MAGDGDLVASTMGTRGLLGHRQRALSRTHLKPLLGHKVLHAPNDLDGGPMVLPQPAEEEEKGVSGHPARGVEPSEVSPAACGLALLGTRRMLNPLEWKSLWPRPGGCGEERLAAGGFSLAG